MNPLDPPEADLPAEPLPELSDRLDDTVVTIPCYEPAGQRLELSGRALVTHTLLLGQTGSGKTSILRWFLRSLIQHAKDDPDHRPGVFIFDLNGDDTVGLVKKWAAEAGRSDDVRLLTPTTGYLDLFANVRSLEDLPSATAQFMHGGWIVDSDNGYWNETTRTLIDAALSVCLIVSGRLETDEVLRFLTNWLVAKRPSPDDEALLAKFEAMASIARGVVDKHLLSKIEYVQATIKMWTKLDGKTQGILNSCLLDAFSPLISLETRRYIDSARKNCFLPEDIVKGLVMVFSLPAAKNLESAALLGRIMKSRLFTALQERPQNRNQRLCAILADEYHYLASGGMDRSSDVTALATLRSRSVAVIAATQSLDHLASVMGSHDFRSLIPNFGSHFFFRSTEATTGAFATAVMGTRAREANSGEEKGYLLVDSPPNPTPEYNCPPGALACLEPCQGYVALSSGYRSPGMIWLGGLHESPGPGAATNPSAIPPDDPLQKLREATASKPQAVPELSSPSSGEPTFKGFPPEMPLHYGVRAWTILLGQYRFQRTMYSSFRSFRMTLANFGHHPAGLDSLPICWWDAVAKLTLSFARQHPMKLIGLHQVNGCLAVTLSDTTAPAETYFAWIARLQKSLYPIRTRPLKPRDEHILGSDLDYEAVQPDDASEDDK